MRASGIAIMHAPPAEVWVALSDPAVLAVAIPGCQDFEASGPQTYRFTIAAGIGSLQGSYSGDITLSDQQEPTSFVLAAAGTGAPGTVSVRIRFRLAAGTDGTTELGYDADGVVGGLLAAAGQRMVTAVAQRMASEFFRAVNRQLLAGNVRPDGQSPPPPPAGLVPQPRQAETQQRAESRKPEFLHGALAGTAAALAGVAIGAVVRRRRS